MANPVLESFHETCSGFSADRVLCDPELNQRFLDACRKREVPGSDAELNRRLLAIRKSGGIGKGYTQKRTRFDDAPYRFAAEISARHLERREKCSLDEILICPDRAREFDQLAEQLAPGFRSVQYRLSAMKLRKLRQFAPEPVSRVGPTLRIQRYSCRELNTGELPSAPGIYLFLDSTRVLYVGEAGNLRTRLAKHLDHSDNRELARWFWGNSLDDIWIELQVMPDDTTVRVRRALELELIRSRRPAFNIAGANIEGRDGQ